MPRHVASITVHAKACDVYRMWMHFPDYPKFMSHVRSVSYIDGERTRWIVNIVGRHEWAARNENWIPDRQIGWRSIDGMENSGLVEFVERPNGDTQINVAIEYTPPAGVVGKAAEILGAGKAFEGGLRADLERFARTLENRDGRPTARSKADVPAAPAPPAPSAAVRVDTASRAESVPATDPVPSGARRAACDA